MNLFLEKVRHWQSYMVAAQPGAAVGMLEKHERTAPKLGKISPHQTCGLCPPSPPGCWV